MDDVGSYVNRNENFNSKFNKKTIIQTLAATANPLILDIGAHKGESLKLFLDCFKSPTIHAFEPGEQAFSQLKNTFGNHSNIILNNKAIHESEGTKDFYLNPLSHTNSFLKVNKKSKDSIMLNSGKISDSQFEEEYNHKISVQSLRLDNYLESHQIKKVDLLKIDTQGSEVQVIKSLGRFLNCVSTIVVEISLFDYYENKSSFFAIEEALGKNFQLYSIIEISQNPMNGRTDCVTTAYTKIN